MDKEREREKGGTHGDIGTGLICIGKIVGYKLIYILLYTIVWGERGRFNKHLSVGGVGALVCVELILNFISCSVASASGVVGDCGRGWTNNTKDFNSQTECSQFVNQSNAKPRSVDDICTDCVHYVTVNRV